MLDYHAFYANFPNNFVSQYVYFCLLFSRGICKEGKKKMLNKHKIKLFLVDHCIYRH